MTTDNTSRNTPDRMDLPFVGLMTFACQPACPDWDRLDGADAAVLGVPIDTASSYRVGTREVARRFEVVGADFVEVSPPYDPSGITSLLAARISLDFIGSILHERAKRRR
jgi:arginase family enzyme